MKLQRAAGLTAFFVVGLATALHLALLAAWRFSIAPDLEQARFPEELSRNTIDLFPSPSADWAELSANGLHLRAPIREPAAAAISRCARRCQLPLAAGKLTIFAEALGETYEEQLLAMSPSREDVALLRAPWRNWRTIRSLAHHANMPNPLPPTERFASPATRGILTYFHSQGVDRWVIYAYAVRGMASQKLALSGASWEVLLTLLGSLRFAEES